MFGVGIRAILASEPFPWQRYYHHLFTVALLLLILLLFCRVVYCLGTATSCVLVRSFSPSISAHAHKISVLFCYRGLSLHLADFFPEFSSPSLYSRFELAVFRSGESCSRFLHLATFEFGKLFAQCQVSRCLLLHNIVQLLIGDSCESFLGFSIW